MSACEICNGAGTLPAINVGGDGTDEVFEPTCPECHGSGERP